MDNSNSTTDRRPPTTSLAAAMVVGRRSSVVGRQSALKWLLIGLVALYVGVLILAPLGGLVAGALAEYCANNEGHACEASSQCCAGFACAAGACRRITAGTCLFAPDAGGVQPSGEGCGCSSDCASGACTDSRCP